VTDLEFAPRHLGLKFAACSSEGVIRIYEAMDVMNLTSWSQMVCVVAPGACDQPAGPAATYFILATHEPTVASPILLVPPRVALCVCCRANTMVSFLSLRRPLLLLLPLLLPLHLLQPLSCCCCSSSSFCCS